MTQDVVARVDQPKIISISSEYGSVSANTAGFPYYYSASKAALNMLMRSLAVDARRWGITTVLFDPGWVSTDIGGHRAPTTLQQSVEGMIRALDTLAPEHNGRFFTWQGNEQVW